MLAPLTSSWYLDPCLSKVALKLNFEVRAEYLAFASYGLDKSTFDSLNTLFERYHQLIVLNVVDDILRTIVNDDKYPASISRHVLPHLANLHDFNCILGPICVQKHCEINHLIVPLLVVGRIS